jgi:hypothetical protein
MRASSRSYAHLRPLAVKLYAESRGWEHVPLEGARFWLFRHPTQRLRQLQVPMDEDAGFEDAMFDVVRRLSELEERPIEQIVADLQWPDADVVRVRVASHESDAGQLSLTRDVAMREGVRRALLASACSVVRPLRYHPRLSGSDPDALLAACRAGQTEQGSYVLKFICPLHVPDIGGRGRGEDIPFTRKVTVKLMTSTAKLVDDIEGDRIESYEDDQAHAQFSWNLCDALLRMQPDDGQIELRMQWAADRHTLPPGPEVPSAVAIKADYFPFIEQIAGRLRPRDGAEHDELLIGTVAQLLGTVGEDGRRSGEVLFVLLRGGEEVPAKAMLDAEQYATAIRAHELGDAYVKLVGRLRRGQRISRIDPVGSLDLVGRA